MEKSTPLGLPGKAFQGDNYYSATNLGPEAIIRYFYPAAFKSQNTLRKDKEKKATKASEDNHYPTYDELKSEKEQQAPHLIFSIKNSNGLVVKKFQKKRQKVYNRFTGI